MLTPQLFKDILFEAELTGTPKGFERAVLREYIQCEILFLLSNLRGSEKLAFIGGTSLRLLYNLDRFSEDLDFDNCGLTNKNAAVLINRLIKFLRQRDYRVTFKFKSAGLEKGGSLVFSGLLFDLGLSAHKDEKLMIKIEYTTPKPVPKTNTVLLSRFGFTTQVTTEPLPALCSRKLLALKNRKRLQPRDLYDLAWFFSRRVTPDKKTLENFGVISVENFRIEILTMLKKHRSKFSAYERDLAPFVLNKQQIIAIRHVPQMLEEILH